MITGGAGQDNIYGGVGADDFKFLNQVNFGTLAANTHDKIFGFTTTSDELKFTGANFTGVAANDTITKSTNADANKNLIVAAAANWAGGTVVAKDAAQRFMFDTSSGRLWYDGDGSTSTISIKLIAQLLDGANNPITDIAAADIDIV